MRITPTQIITTLACSLLIGTACDTPNADEQAPLHVHVSGVDDQQVEPEQLDFIRYRLINQTSQDADDQLSATEPSDAFCIDAECLEWVIDTDEPGLVAIEASYCGHLQTKTVAVNSATGSDTIAAKDITISFDPARCQDAGNELATSPQDDTDLQADGLDTVCDLSARPSAYVYTARRYGDFLKLEPVDDVWMQYIADGEVVTDSGRCVDQTEDGCVAWSVGWEQPGRIEVFTEWCDTEVRKTVFVPETDDGCHVETQYITLLLETTGCLSADTSEEPLPEELNE